MSTDPGAVTQHRAPDWDLPQLRALAAVVDHGSLEAAARALSVTPSAVSQRLKALERTVGAVLLRRTRPVRVTAQGEPVLRFARQVDLLAADAELAAQDAGAAGPVGGTTSRPTLRLAVNADSLATWVLPALAPLSADVDLVFVREDQDHTAEVLRTGDATAAVTSVSTPVQGCTVTPLGAMRYLPMASPAFARRHFPEGLTTASLAVAPVVVFDDRDRLQHRLLEDWGVRSAPPSHVVPASAEFVTAVRLGYGWGMVPELQVPTWTAADAVVLTTPDGAPSPAIDVTLFWQQWSLRTATLDAVASAVRTAAADALRPMATSPSAKRRGSSGRRGGPARVGAGP